MIQKIKALALKVLDSFVKDKKHEMNNTKFKWNNEYSFHPAIDESLHPPKDEKKSFEDMTKLELEAYGRTIGVELDRRHNKKKLILQLETRQKEKDTL